MPHSQRPGASIKRRQRFPTVLGGVVCLLSCTQERPARIVGTNESTPVVYRRTDARVVVEDASPGVDGAGTLLLENVGIETLGGVFTVLLAKGRRCPCEKTETFSTAADDQTQIKISIYRGQGAIVKDVVGLGTYEIQGIKPAPRGTPLIDVTFSVVGRQIRMAATDQRTGQPMAIAAIPPP